MDPANAWVENYSYSYLPDGKPASARITSKGGAQDFLNELTYYYQ